MSTHPTNYGFSRLKYPPSSGRTGITKAKAMVFGVSGVFGPDDNGMYTLRTVAQATPHCLTAQDIRALASPDAEIAIYVSATGCHSVVRYKDQDWAVIAIKAKYQHYKDPDGTKRTTRLHQDVIVIKPGTTVKHTRSIWRGEEGLVGEGKGPGTYTKSVEVVTWPGLLETSKKYVQDCIEAYAFK